MRCWRNTQRNGGSWTACAGSASRAFTGTRGCGATWSEKLLPRLAAQALARGESRLRIWSAGCASGEEPYTLALMFAFGKTSKRCEPAILATDADSAFAAPCPARLLPPDQPAGAAADLAHRVREVRQ